MSTLVTVNAAKIARLAYGYELMFKAICEIAGTSGGSTQWFTQMGAEVQKRIEPLWNILEDSNAHVPGDCLSHHKRYADWAVEVEQKAKTLDQQRRWRVFECIMDRTHFGIELEDAGNDDDPILYSMKIKRETVQAIVDAHNSSLASS